MKTLEQIAKEIASKANECCHRSDGWEDGIEVIALQALSEERRRILEECATLADNYTKPLFLKNDIISLMGMDTVIKLREIHRKEIAEAIRNLKDK